MWLNGQEIKSTVPWGKVEERVEKAVIVAGGPSAREIDWKRTFLPNDIALVSVNCTLPYVGGATHWFTVDPAPRNKQVMWECRTKHSIKFYCGAPDDYVRTESWVAFLKKRTGDGPRLSCFGLSEDPEWISTGNSAYGALGLLYLMGVKKVALFGADGTEKYWYDSGTPFGDLSVMKALFASAVPQLQARGIEVINGSMESIVDCFPRVKPREALEWISR